MNQQTNPDLVSGEIKPAAWMTEDGRVCTAQTKDTAMPSQVAASFNIPLDTRPAAHDDLVKALQEANFKLQAMQVDYTGPAAQSIYVLRERISAALAKAGVK